MRVGKIPWNFQNGLYSGHYLRSSGVQCTLFSELNIAFASTLRRSLHIVTISPYSSRVERGELEGRKLRFCLFAQMVWPGNMYLSVNSLCREMLDLFRLCVAEEMDGSSKVTVPERLHPSVTPV